MVKFLLHKQYNQRAGTHADILGLGFLPFISPHYYLLQAVRRGGRSIRSMKCLSCWRVISVPVLLFFFWEWECFGIRAFNGLDVVGSPFWRDDGTAKATLHRLTGIAGNAAALLGNALALGHCLRIRLAGVLCGSHLSKCVESQVLCWSCCREGFPSSVPYNAYILQ